VTRNAWASGPVSYLYRMLVTPIALVRDGVRVAQGFEYAAFSERGLGVPGLFFLYRFTPYAVAVHARPWSALADVASTAGFLFAIAALALALVNRAPRDPERRS